MCRPSNRLWRKTSALVVCVCIMLHKIRPSPDSIVSVPQGCCIVTLRKCMQGIE